MNISVADLKLIDWVSIQDSYSGLSLKERATTAKFVHIVWSLTELREWKLYKRGNRKCESCRKCLEDQHHVLHCELPTATLNMIDNLKKLYNKLKQISMHPDIITLITTAENGTDISDIQIQDPRNEFKELITQ